GEPPPTPEEERRRLSRLRVLRFALTLVLAYAGFRISRALHRLMTGRHRPRPAIAQASLEDIYSLQQGVGRNGGRGQAGTAAATAANRMLGQHQGGTQRLGWGGAGGGAASAAVPRRSVNGGGAGGGGGGGGFAESGGGFD
ncbi:unnamed protein product, partial [Hapterophycus canaliculatus]